MNGSELYSHWYECTKWLWFLLYNQELDDSDLAELAVMSMEDSDVLEYKDDGYIELVLKILGLVCDGQNLTLQVWLQRFHIWCNLIAFVQDYLREQPDNIKSVNLIAETARFLSLVYSSISVKTIGLVTELFSTLVEFTSVSITFFSCTGVPYTYSLLRRTMLLIICREQTLLFFLSGQSAKPNGGFWQ